MATPMDSYYPHVNAIQPPPTPGHLELVMAVAGRGVPESCAPASLTAVSLEIFTMNIQQLYLETWNQKAMKC